MASIVPPSGIPHCPAPWTLRCESWLLTVTLGSTLPEGVYDPLEASSSAFVDPAKSGKFKGGIGMIMIVRYLDTPVGPYDEIIMVPGNYDVPSKRKSLRRISRIYVSQRETTWNGRHNWNIPKHLARFEFTTSSSPVANTTHLKVYPPLDPSNPASSTALPFFSCKMTPFQYFPSFPFSSKWLPLDTTLAQPPIPSALETIESGGAEIASMCAGQPELLVGTQDWKSLGIDSWCPATRGCWVEMEPVDAEVVGNSEKAQARKDALKWWPVDAKPWSLGVYMNESQIEISEPTVWKL